MVWTALAVTILVFFVGARWSVTAQQPDPFVGKWTLNLAKSKYDPGPPPKSFSRTVLDRGNEVWLVTNDGVNADGSPNYSIVTVKPDGQDYPFAAQGQQSILTVALKRPDRYTLDYTLKLDGKPISSTQTVASKDGKSTTETTKGTNAQGKPFTNVVVWDRQ
jgi:hypothetical protein